MEDLKTQIREILKDSLFIKEERKQKILQNIDIFPEKKLEALLVVLQKAKEREAKAVESFTQKNPEYAQYFKNQQYKHFIEKLHKEEEKELEKEKEIIQEIEAELENLSL